MAETTTTRPQTRLEQAEAAVWGRHKLTLGAWLSDRLNEGLRQQTIMAQLQDMGVQCSNVEVSRWVDRLTRRIPK